jgi:hypothetical protein
MEIRARVLQHLGTPHTESRFGHAYLARTIATEANCRPHQVWEALWGLAGDGLVYLDPAGQGPDNWQWRLSETGVQAISGGTWEPRDPDGYLRRLRSHSPAVDPVAIDYISEALSAFNARCYLATSVMLGVASERVVDGLARAVVDARGDSAKQLRDALENPRTSQFTRFTELRKQLASLRPELPEGLADVLTLDAVADLLRLTRNEAGHPTGAAVDEDTAYTHLQMGARYIQKMTALQYHFRIRSKHDSSFTDPY